MPAEQPRRLNMPSRLNTCLWLLATTAALAAVAPSAAAITNPADEYDAIDTNDDGRVSSSEFEVHTRKVFDGIDSDADDKLTNKEILAAEASFNRWVFTTGAMLGPAQLTTAERIARIDVNQDGVVSQSEHANAAAAKFRAMDLNNNGELSLMEFDPGW